jgi:putative transposase
MSYPSDLSDEEWELIKAFFDCGKYGNQAVHEKRALVNAVRYLTKTGCQWRQLPNDFPPWSTVHTFFRRARLKGIWQAILELLVKRDREKMGRSPDPSFAVIDSQSSKTTSASEDRGIDGGKKNKRPEKTYCNRYTGAFASRKSTCGECT